MWTRSMTLLDKVHEVPSRPLPAPMRMPISGICEIKGVGDVPGEEILLRVQSVHAERFALWKCTISASIRHVQVTTSTSNFKGPRHEQHASTWRSTACPGDNVAVDIKHLDKKSGRPSLRTTRRWWPAGAPAPCSTMAHTQTYHETSAPVDTQIITMTPTLMTSIATQTTNLRP